MRATTLLAAAISAAAAPALVSAGGTLGFALGNKMPSGVCKTQADFEADFVAIAANADAKVVRIYAASDCDTAKNILPAAKNKGFQVVLGIWYACCPCCLCRLGLRTRLGGNQEPRESDQLTDPLPTKPGPTRTTRTARTRRRW